MSADELDEVAVHTMLLTRGEAINLGDLAKGMEKGGLLEVTHTTHGRIFARMPSGAEYLVAPEQTIKVGKA